MSDTPDIEKGVHFKPDDIRIEHERIPQARRPSAITRRFTIPPENETPVGARKKELKKDKDNDDANLAPITLKSLYKMIVIYMLPLGTLIAIPIILACVWKTARMASIGGVPLLQFFIWIEISWVSLWSSKLIAKLLPFIVRPLVSSGVRKYCRQLQHLENPLAWVGGTFAMYIAFYPMMHQVKPRNGLPKLRQQPWQTVVQEGLAATLCSALVYLGKCVIIQIVQVRYHQQQFAFKIKQSKKKVGYLVQLLKASKAKTAEYNDPDLRMYDDVLFNQTEEKITYVAWDIHHTVTGKKKHDAEHKVVIRALERGSTSEALARRIWWSLVPAGKDALYLEDLEKLDIRPKKQKDNEKYIKDLFEMLDMDKNGNVSEDEAADVAVAIHRERNDLHRGTTDIKSAVDALDWLILFACFILMIFTYIAFLTNQIKNTFAFAGALLAGSAFAFSGTIEGLMASIIFIFVRHPYDVGDRVDFSDGEYFVQDISLLYTVFQTVQGNKLLHIGNTTMADKEIDNISRSISMKESIRLDIHFDTTFEQVEALKADMEEFVRANNRDYNLETLDIRIWSFDLDKYELQVECKYKGSWANPAPYLERREKFQRELIRVLKKHDIEAPDPLINLGTQAEAADNASIASASTPRRRVSAGKAKLMGGS